VRTGPGGATTREARASIDVPVAMLTWVAAWLAGQLLFQLVVVASGDDGDVDLLPIPTLGLAVVATWVAYLVGLWWASTRHGTGDPRADYAVTADVSDLVGVPIGVLAQLVLVPLVYLPLRAVWPDTFSESALEETARDLVDRASGVSVVVLVLMVVVGAPIVEELVYRGLLQGSFARRINEPLALLAASAWFAVIHFRPVEYPGLFVAGLVFGACFMVTGRVTTAIVAHVAFNAAGLATAWAA
jgi:uncharacterized protein